LVYWWSHWVLAYSFHSSCVWLRVLLFFSVITILSLSSEVQASTCSRMLEWHSTVFFVWQKGLISRIFVWFFFLKFSISLFNSSFKFCVVFFISYISLFIVSFEETDHFGLCWSPLWVPLFVSVSSQVLYLWRLEISWVHLVIFS
jgi:hypothetical protein